MKRNDLFILCSTACYSFLFYQQLAGLNFLLFTLLLATFLYIRTENRWQNKGFMMSALGAILSGISILLYGTNLAIVCNVISLMFMSAFSLNTNNSLIIHLFHSVYSHITVFIYMIIDIVNKLTKTNADIEEIKKPNIFQKILLISIPGLISIIFFSLYRSSNDAFKELTNKINLDFISIPLLFFTLSGMFLMYAFFLQRSIRQIREFDTKKTNHLDQDYILQNPDWLTKAISPHFEVISGIILFAMLNLLLAIVNGTDIMYVWTKHQLPEHVTYSKFVHNGIGALITSIIFAISIILFYFRGAINFDTKNKSIKYLAYLWILQNVFMLVSTMMRNKMYIEQYSLTEKRIGVFIYLLLALIGLCITMYKIASKKNNIFLFRANSWACYLVMIMCCCVNWSPLITAYNIHKSKTVKRFALDIDYLGNLSYNNLKLLINYHLEHPTINEEQSSKIDDKIIEILLKNQENDWRSLVLARDEMYNYLLLLNQQHKLLQLDASGKALQDLSSLKALTNLESLNLNFNQITHVQAFNTFKNLKELKLSNNQILNIDTLAILPSLQILDLSNNLISHIDISNKTPYLKELNLSKNKIENLDGIDKIKSLERINLSNNSIMDLSLLDRLPLLNQLIFQSNQIAKIPFLPSLQILDISLSSATENNYKNWIDDKNLGNLTELNASNTSLIHSGILSSDLLKQNLISLDISNDKFQYLDELVHYDHLQRLDISGNNLLQLERLPSLPNLEMLVAQQTTFQSLHFLNAYPHLNFLDLSNASCALTLDSLINQTLDTLILNNCNLKYISTMVSFKNLIKLSIFGTNLDDISFVRNSKKLETLSLSIVREKDIDIILSLANLKRIECDNISDDAYQRIISAKPNVNIIQQSVETRYSMLD